jgi:hypothetical protein
MKSWTTSTQTVTVTYLGHKKHALTHAVLWIQISIGFGQLDPEGKNDQEKILKILQSILIWHK